MADLSLPSSLLRINDIELKVPPKSINIVQEEYNAAAATLRTSNTTRVKSGQKTVSIFVDTYFATGYNARRGTDERLESWINEQLSPLLIQVKKCPFVSIENEKIRKEVTGSGTSTNNLAAIVQSIEFDSKIREPGIVYVRLHLELFNYLPFSESFSYREDDGAGNFEAVPVPGKQFNSFIQAGTKSPKDPNSYVNSYPLTTSEDLEIIYKEYREFDIDKLFDINIEEYTTLEPNARERTAIPNRIPPTTQTEKMREQGWKPVEDFEASERTGRTFFRYNKIIIKAGSAREELASGRLIVEAISAYIKTKTSRIPLLSHSIPTAQFLGGIDSGLSILLFANAELDSNEKPAGTSEELAKLIKVLDIVSQNAIDFHRASKNDAILVRHPLAQLLAYKLPDETSEDYYDEETGFSIGFDPRDYISCIVDRTETTTVQGMPYCTRLNLIMSENYRSSNSDYKQRDIRSSSIYTATKNLVKSLIDKYDIQPVVEGDKKSVRINASGKIAQPDQPISFGLAQQAEVSTDPDFPVAKKLERYLNGSLVVNDFNDSNDAIDDPVFNERSNKEADSLYRQNIGEANPVSLRELSKNPKYKRLLDEAKTPDDLRRVGALIRKESGSTGLRRGELDAVPLSSERINEVASDLLSILSETNPSDERYLAYQKDLDAFKGANLIQNSPCYPDLLLDADGQQPDYFFWNESDRRQSINDFKRKLGRELKERHEKVMSNYVENLASVTAAEKQDAAPTLGPVLGAYNFPATGKPRPSQAKTDKAAMQNPMNKVQQEEIINRVLETFNDNTYTMRRAMPTFKIFFKEGGEGSFNDIDRDRIEAKADEGIWRSFTSFYDINGIVDIRLVKDKDNPADLLVIRLLNTKEDIVNKQFEDPTDEFARKRRAQKQRLEDRAVFRNRTADVVIKEGSKIELRLGNDGDPNNLTVEFSGRIVKVGGGDIVEILCQGDGVELIQELKGIGDVDPDDTDTSTTQELISKLLHESPEVKSFGATSSKTLLGNVEFLWTGAGGRSAIENIFAPPIFTEWKLFDTEGQIYADIGAAVGFFLGAGLFSIVTSAIGYAAGLGIAAAKKALTSPEITDGVKYTIYNKTIWDILQEMTLRHPGTVCGVVPFDQRSTIFFGYPEQLYFFKGLNYFQAKQFGKEDVGEALFSFEEENLQNTLKNKLPGVQLHKLRTSKQLKDKVREKQGGGFFDSDADLFRRDQEDVVGQVLPSVMKPFINYHVITSEHDIISNDMSTTSEGVHNSIRVIYPQETEDGNFNGMVGFADYEATDEIKADDDLFNEYIKRRTQVYHNAHNDIKEARLPQKYAIATLCRSLNGIYTGKIKIIGRPNIKPYDVVFVFDSYNNIFGPVQVRSVVHTLSHDTGWVTEIVPQMIVTPAMDTFIPHVNTMKKMAMAFYLRNLNLFYKGRVKEANQESYITDKNVKTALTLAETFHTVLGGAAALEGAKDIYHTAAQTGVSKATKAKKILQGTKASNLGRFARVAKAANVGGGVKFVGAKLAGGALTAVLGIGITLVSAGFASWNRNRQPINFLPVTRNGKEWYTGLHGLKDNQALDAIKDATYETLDKIDYFIDYIKDEFQDII